MQFGRDMRVRWVVLATLVGAAGIACLAIVLYESYVPARISEVVGSVVTREVIADLEAMPRHYVYVRLDGGRTVRARVDRHVTVMPGERVLLAQRETALLRLQSYQYKRHVHAVGTEE